MLHETAQSFAVLPSKGKEMHGILRLA